MADDEKALRTVVKDVRAKFYTNKGNKKFVSRRMARKQGRVEKKAKQHKDRFTKKTDSKSSRKDVSEDIPIKKKKKKKRKKRKIEETKEEDESFDYAREAYEAATRQDDKLIATLGKKLKVGKKLPKIFEEDGLDYLLDVCEPLGADEGNDSSDEEYLAMKKAKKRKTDSDNAKVAFATQEDVDSATQEDVDSDLLDDVDFSIDDEESDNEEMLQEDEDELSSCKDEVVDEVDDGNAMNEDSDEDQVEFDNDEATTKGEPESNKTLQPGKYIPPALRKANLSQNSEEVQRERLKKQLKGLLNRLSSATLPGITGEIEKCYSKHSRNMTNECLCELILDACVCVARMPERLICEHMMLVAALHTVVGSEVGSFILQKLSESFDSKHQEANDDYGEGKECDNMLIMFAALYQFKIVDSMLIYDLIKRLAVNFREHDVEMILSLLKVCGPDIRKDDPGTLKEVMLEIQAKSMSCAEVQDRSRLRYMLETINALKNNNMRKIPNHDPSVYEDAKKQLKHIVKGRESINSGVQLKISLNDLINAKEKGRWWVIGSAWSGRTTDSVDKGEDKTVEDSIDTKVLEVAKQQRMNTDLRRTIFCSMMTSEDYLDAFEKLLKLSLKERQAREIIHVLIDCCLQERAFNPFYAHLADKLCEYSRSNQVTFQYSFWDRFKTIARLSKHGSENLALLLAHMFASKSISMSILKGVNFGTLDKASIRFFTRMFSILLLQYPRNVSKAAFERIHAMPKLLLLREGIKIFLSHFLLPNQADEEVKPSENNELKEIVDICISALDGREYVKL